VKHSRTRAPSGGWTGKGGKRVEKKRGGPSKVLDRGDGKGGDHGGDLPINGLGTAHTDPKPERWEI